MTAVAAAGEGAAQAGEDPKRAMKDERDRVGFVKLDDETIDKLGDVLIEKFDLRGAFSPPPEPVKAPEQPAAPPAPNEQSPTEAAAAAGPAPKRTFADRFLGP